MAFAPFLPVYTPEPSRCASGVQPGTAALQEWITEDSPWAAHLTDLGTFNCRKIAGTNRWSSHASGRAGDSGVRVMATGHPAGHALAAWLVKNAGMLGVQEVIWNRRRWDNQSRRWRAYTGVSPHLDHVHWAQNTSGARHTTTARIKSVAPNATPPTPEDPFMALTTAEQKELLTNTRMILGRQSIQVVRRAGGKKVYLRDGGWLVYLAPDQAHSVVGKMLVSLGQASVIGLDTEIFDALIEPADA